MNSPRDKDIQDSAHNAKMLNTRSPTGSEVADRAKKEIPVVRRSMEDINTEDIITGVLEQPDPGPERSKQAKTEITRK